MIKVIGKSHAQRRLHKLLSTVNLTGDTYIVIDRSHNPVAVIISARDWATKKWEEIPNEVVLDTLLVEEDF